jgi:DUF4097 and DUF4098 domain-containing protein YvlB
MNKIKLTFRPVLFLSIVMIFAFATMGYPQAPAADRVEIPLTNPSKPASVKVNLVTGSIMVTGYSGNTVVVEAEAKPESPGKEDDKELDVEVDTDVDVKTGKTAGRNEKSKEKSKGMFHIQNSSTGLTVVEENNEVIVKTHSFMRRVDVTLKVPFKTSLALRTVNNGEITVEKVEGELNINHVNGPVTLKNIGGSVVANTVNGDLTVTFDNIYLDKPMSFSSFNGDVDVTFPANAKFNLKMKSDQGEIYSDFQLQTKPAPANVEKEEKKEKGKYMVSFDKSVYAALNGGGQKVVFKTFNGDIYIRKKK